MKKLFYLMAVLALAGCSSYSEIARWDSDATRVRLHHILIFFPLLLQVKLHQTPPRKAITQGYMSDRERSADFHTRLRRSGFLAKNAATFSSSRAASNREGSILTS